MAKTGRVNELAEVKRLKKQKAKAKSKGKGKKK